MDEMLLRHWIDPGAMRADDFDGFMRLRQDALTRLVENAMGKQINRMNQHQPAQVDLDDVPAEMEVP